MKKHMVVGSAGIALLALAGWVYLAGTGTAGQAAGLKDGVLKIADAIKKSDQAGADKQAAALAKKIEDLADLMELFKKRDKGGIGVGSKTGVAVPDGIELKLVGMGRDSLSPAALKKEAEALEEMGHVVAAMATITKVKPVAKVKAKEWNGWCDDMASASQKFSAAAKAQNAAELKTLAGKINASCNSCHSTYRK